MSDAMSAAVAFSVRTAPPAELDAYWVHMHAQAPATQLAIGVYRCYVPPHEAGTVGMCVSYGDGRPRSNVARFTYRITPQTARAQDDL